MLSGNYMYRKDRSLIPEIHNILYYVNKNDPNGAFPSDPASDPQFNNWEWAVRNFYH